VHGGAVESRRRHRIETKTIADRGRLGGTTLLFVVRARMWIASSSVPAIAMAMPSSTSRRAASIAVAPRLSYPVPAIRSHNWDVTVML